MYINNEERKAKSGKIDVSVSRDNTIKLKFTYPKGKRNDINIATNTEEGWLKAKMKSTQNGSLNANRDTMTENNGIQAPSF